MRDLVSRFLNHGISRRDFVKNLAALGLTATAVATVLETLDRMEYPAGKNLTAPEVLLSGTGGELLVAQARAAGVEYMFTNPGSFEVGLFDAIVDDKEIRMVEALHEGIVLSMADGYHKVSGKPGFVNVHAIAGTAQMAGQLYNSCRDGSALVITAALSDNEVWSDEVLLGPRPGFDQKDINRQFTKISWESRDAASIPIMLRRAFKVATTPPGGPVYLATASYALEEKNTRATIYPAERFLLPVRVHPDPVAIEKAARALMDAKNPVIIAGDEVWKSGAQDELLQFAESFGVPVVKPGGTILGCAYQPFPTAHPLHLGTWLDFYDGVGATTDLVFFVGAPDAGGRTIPKSPELPTKSPIIRLGMNLSDDSRNYPTDVVLMADVKAGLHDLHTSLESLLTKSAGASIIRPRAEHWHAISDKIRQAAALEIQSNMGKLPIHPYELGKVMAEVLDQNAIFVTENLSGKFESFRFGYRPNEMMFLGNSGDSLGWGIGAAIGAKLAAPDRQVVCSIGDGSVMYGASGFWTQARYQIPVLTVVWNNRNYQTVRLAYHAYGGKMARSGKYAGMYLGDPDIDFVKLAESQGVSGERVTNGKDLRAALERGTNATKAGKPYLIEVVVARFGGGADSTWHESFRLKSQPLQSS